MKLGAHLSTAGDITKPLKSIVEKGGNCLQIFSSSPRTWADSTIDAETIQTFVKTKEELEIDPIYFHACYLINLANGEATGEKSVHSLIFELNSAQKMGVKGSIVHTGSFGKMTGDENISKMTNYLLLITNIQKVLEQTPKDTLLILENAGNRKIGKKIDHLASIIQDVRDERIRVCLDTCHLHAAGYNLNSQDDFENFLKEFDNKIGLNKLEVVHMNDSRDELGSLRDRHDNIGKGHVGMQVFKNLLTNPRTKQLPFIIETPGFDGNGPDKMNLDILKGLITT